MIPAPYFRLPSETHIAKVTLQVADLERSVAYYRDVIGFRVLQTSHGGATLGTHGDDTPLLELREREGIRPVPRSGLLGLYHFAIRLPDRPALGRFLQHLAELGGNPGMSDHSVSEAIYLHDPDNLGIEVYADRPRAEWIEEHGQLRMTTIPLDTRSLLRAAGGHPWAGAPAGTKIGHVHLHVGDIDEASAFYHDALGFDKTVWSYPGALFLSAGGYHHHLGTNTWARGAPSASSDDARLIEWEIAVPSTIDVDSVARSLARGSYGVTRDGDDAVTSDPWGTQLRIRGRERP